MRFAKPEEMEAEPPEMGENTKPPEASELMVSHPEFGEMSVEELLSLHTEMLEQPDSFGIATERRMQELEATTARQQKQIDELHETVDELVTFLAGKVGVDADEMPDWEHF